MNTVLSVITVGKVGKVLRKKTTSVYKGEKEGLYPPLSSISHLSTQIKYFLYIY